MKDKASADVPADRGVVSAWWGTHARALRAVVEQLLKKYPGVAVRHVDHCNPAAQGDNFCAAVYLYTCESAFYRRMNAALRDPDRGRVRPYFGYLRLLLEALSKLDPRPGQLWRGVGLDMRRQYPVGRTVTWWGVSSCTSEPGLARGFMGSKGKRTLLEVTPVRAVGIRHLSAFTGEEEFLLPPGTRLTVTAAATDRTGLTTVRLAEQAGDRLVT